MQDAVATVKANLEARIRLLEEELSLLVSCPGFAWSFS